ncbi:MAG: carbohydrate binding family 9 domain-containing protein [Acidobacteria bacterium]|nr:carbohydrate binding family 9 domain-containing protein [Acidobacteriota bacterium]
MRPTPERARRACAFVVLVGAVGLALAGPPATSPGPAPRVPNEHRIPRAAGPITVDGVLDEPAWSGALALPIAYEVRQSENGPTPVVTRVLLMFDDDNLYAAFRAEDPEPARIRAHFTDRDRAYEDDFVGLALDTFDDARRGVEFFVNPLGVQSDLVITNATGNEDDTWDAIWDSAGRITESGYDVEIAIPFSSLRFHPGAGTKRWGVDAFRVYPREKSYQAGLVPRDRNRDCYQCQFDKLVGFEGATPGRNIEITPTIVASASREFDGELGRLGERDDDLEPGVTARWGLTPNLTLQGTLNPDFSQVEADALQLAVNEQFALFYPEKRPFFLEGADYYATPLDPVYTRTVTDPDAGFKLNGKVGPNAIGAFVARDDVTNLLFPGPQGSASTLLDQQADAGVLRYRRDVGRGSTVGVLGTGRRGDGYENYVAGADADLRFDERSSLQLQWLGSSTRYPREIVAEFGQPDGRFDDDALYARYLYQQRKAEIYAEYLDVGPRFRADLGFLPQADWRRATAGGSRIWRGTADTWYSSIILGSDWDRSEQHDGTLIEEELEAWFEFSGPRQSLVSLDAGVRDRQFGGVTFDQQFVNLTTEVTPFGGLNLRLFVNAADDIDFEGASLGLGVRDGNRLRMEPSLTWYAGRHLTTQLAHIYRDLRLPEGWLFRANLTELRLVYQFSRRTFVRAIVQRTDIANHARLYEDLLPRRTRNTDGQFLFSYKINPVTALYVGYNGSYFRLDDEPTDPVARTLFVKLGYAFVL